MQYINHNQTETTQNHYCSNSPMKAQQPPSVFCFPLYTQYSQLCFPHKFFIWQFALHYTGVTFLYRVGSPGVLDPSAFLWTVIFCCCTITTDFSSFSHKHCPFSSNQPLQLRKLSRREYRDWLDSFLRLYSIAYLHWCLASTPPSFYTPRQQTLSRLNSSPCHNIAALSKNVTVDT